MRPIIKVENLSKEYKIGESRASYSTLRDSIVGAIKNPLKRVKRSNNTFWALKDVNFEIYPGEVVGIVGRNGAGKSTLLKILSRITEPTTGEISLYGRVGSLLEVGTGFHPELTGRENIFLNGAILGMRREEISKKFDEIVAFAEIEKFLDTAVKHYSSGMYVRLAFAVAAHLEPEILVIDEVLAVGDAEFQKKCLGKMGEVSKMGRTVIFVSHNMTAVQSLCTKAISLSKGEVKQVGNVQEVINTYLAKDVAHRFEQEWELKDAPGNDAVKVKKVKLVPHYLPNSDVIDVRTPIDILFEFWNFEPNQINVSFHLYNLKGECVMNLGTPPLKAGEGIFEGVLSIPGNFLNDDSYYISILIVKDTSVALFNLGEVLSFEVEDWREGSNWYGKWVGTVRPTFLNCTLKQLQFR